MRAATTCRLRPAPALAAVFFAMIAHPLPAAPDTTSSLQREALALTARRRLPEAEAAYRRLAALSPDDGFPALGRFLARTGRTTEAAALAAEPALAAAPALLRARVAAATGDTSGALAVLRASLAADAAPAPGAFAGGSAAASDLHARASLAAGLARSSGHDSEAASILAAAATSPGPTPSQRRELVRAVSMSGDGAVLATVLPDVTARLVSGTDMPFPMLRETVWEAMTATAASPAFPRFADSVRAAGTTSPTAAWLSALVAIKRGDAASAARVLEATTSGPLSRRERLFVDEELARLVASAFPERAMALYEGLIRTAPDADRLRLAAAQVAFKMKDYSGSARLLAAIDRRALTEGSMQAFSNTRLAALAMLDRPADLVAAYEQETSGAKWTRARELAEAPFARLTETADHHKVRAAVEARLTQPGAQPLLHALRMSAMNQLRDTGGVTAALADYVIAVPGDLEARAELGVAIGGQALDMGKRATMADAPSTAPAAVKQVADAAADALWRVARAKPYEPEGYIKLMELYRAFGHPELALQAARAPADEPGATPERVAFAAFLCATNGFPKESIPLYERALKEQPGNTKFRLNYAGALTRVDRFDEADTILRDLMKHGSGGKQFHTHELYLAALQLADKRGKVPEFLAFARALGADSAVPQRDVLLLDMARMLVGNGRAADAPPFLETAAGLFPAKRGEAKELLSDTYMGMKDFDRAEKVGAELAAEAASPEEKLRASQNLAVVKARRGDLDGAVKLWSGLAEASPNDRRATRGLISAAQALGENDRKTEARDLLNRYLKMATGDADGEATARQTLERMTP